MSEARNSYVYVIENTNVLCPTAYVGKANNPFQRLKGHIKESLDPRPRFQRSHFSNAIRKHGVSSFVMHVVEKCVTETEAFEKEREWISYLRSQGVNLYNKSPGGYGGQKRATLEQTRRKMSEVHKRRQQSNELRRRTSEALRNHIRTEQHRQNISRVHQKPIEQLDLLGTVITKFPSGIDAEKATGASRSKICECCKGRRNKAGGFRWRYAT